MVHTHRSVLASCHRQKVELLRCSAHVLKLMINILVHAVCFNRVLSLQNESRCSCTLVDVAERDSVLSRYCSIVDLFNNLSAYPRCSVCPDTMGKDDICTSGLYDSAKVFCW